MDLTNDLRAAIETELSNIAVAELVNPAAELRNRYRSSQQSTGKSLINTKHDVDAYAAYRMPATFSAVYSSMRQVQECLTSWSPESLLDIGAGPGTVMWAACAVWSDLQDICLLEREENMIALGKKLAKYSNRTSIQNAEWHKADMIDIKSSSLFKTGKPSFSMVTASYVLGEMKEEHRENFIKNLWQLTDGILLFIEPGTPAGFQHIQQARDLLPALGAYITAPCPCSEPCPMTDRNWCHFSQRVSRSRLHRQVKEADLPYEDEKFSFIALSHIPGKNIHGRVIRHPQVRKGHVIIENCSMGGLETRTVTRKDKEMYHIAKELEWGSEWPFE